MTEKKLFTKNIGLGDITVNINYPEKGSFFILGENMKKKKEPIRNYVAKYAVEFNRATVIQSKKIYNRKKQKEYFNTFSTESLLKCSFCSYL